MTDRVGIGYDVHPLVAGRPLILGGVTVPFDKGLQGHSDGDVLLHALIDALLGAAALGDIGTHFPSSDERYRGISSLLLLEQAAALLRRHGWRVHNTDVTIVAQAPVFKPFIEPMRQAVAARLGVGLDSVSIKAKTTDGLGFEGRGEGIAAHAVAMITKV
ncbi:MAG: 2-C-methyl-D-erythritol 2,4-cyclodiphosphate synthase [Dehalococcoidia bacterium]|nr:2-C-methyl-D-erythritol 2,4-cyclodiphosphate synthase [Dehalococcoidia bacterium]